MVHRHINDLLAKWEIYKTWNPPQVYYFPIETHTISYSFDNNKKLVSSDFVLTEENIISEDEFITKNFVYFSPDGRVSYGMNGFQLWCEKRNIDVKKEIWIYKNTIQKYQRFKNSTWYINGMKKMQDSFKEVFLNEIYYLDFYSIEKYWKTLLGNLMLYGKQTANENIIQKILQTIKVPIYNLIQEKSIDAIAYIPPSIDRKIQLMDRLRSWLNIDLPELQLIKIFKHTPVPQKSLNKKEDRIENAKQTIFIKNQKFSAKTILLIDDAVWSGSTLNETAKKIKEKWFSDKVIWLAIVGSYKGFEVIQEV